MKCSAKPAHCLLISNTATLSWRNTAVVLRVVEGQKGAATHTTIGPCVGIIPVRFWGTNVPAHVVGFRVTFIVHVLRANLADGDELEEKEQ